MALEQISIRVRPDAVDAVRRIVGEINRRPGVEDRLARELGLTRMPKSRRLGEALKRLRALRDTLERDGIARLWIFGSVARGEDGPDSDIDLAADLAPGLSLTKFAALRDRLADALETKADFAQRARLKPHVAKGFAADAVAVW
jgi:predicted nucleotidyltransferase